MMIFKERVCNAFKATRALGIGDEEVKPVLRQLLKVFDKNWEPIEAEDYRALIDTYFELNENKGAEDETKGLVQNEIPERPPERMHFEQQEDQASSTKDNLSQILSRKDQGDLSATKFGHKIGESRRASRTESSSLLPGTQFIKKLKGPIPSQKAPRDRNTTSQRASRPLHSEQPIFEPGSSHLKRKNVHNDHNNREHIKPRTKQIISDHPGNAVIHPGTDCPGSLEVSSSRNLANHLAFQHDASVSNDSTHHKSNVVIATSNLGEVKIVLNCNFAAGLPDFQIPDFSAVAKFLEDKYISIYRLVTPQFSATNLLKDLCDIYLEMAIASRNTPVANTSTPEDRKIGTSHHGLGPNRRGIRISDSDSVLKNKVLNSCGFSNTCNLANTPQGMCDENRLFHNLSDITKGSENVKISLVDEIGSEDLPKFIYMPQNIIYQNAFMQISLARIADVDCCSSCSGDCLLSSIPCACARETGGEFAYAREGFLRDEFLRACISMKQNPQQHHFVFCQDCPFERSKNGYLPEQCKGHLVRKFIKECWRKCGCDMNCGNRVVQRGITCNLQVFMTRGGKGWGVRTLKDLPKGTFVCEYVGEILTNMELYERNMQRNGSERHTYPVTLDADWGSERVLRDEEALCLDATFSGNVARFINHRCNDANLIDIPVEVETPDRHYYHVWMDLSSFNCTQVCVCAFFLEQLALFTTRKVRALEELTWDYGIDFNDHDHPIKAFRCRCGSAFCRDAKRKGTRSHYSDR